MSLNHLEMEIEALIEKMKDINTSLIDFIDATDDSDVAFKTLIIENHKIFQNKEEMQTLFQLISKIADNHHRESDFFDKLEKIFQYLNKDVAWRLIINAKVSPNWSV